MMTKSIAIVGIGCQFPGGSDSVKSYWELLSQGLSAVSEVPKDRWSVGAFHSDVAAGMNGKSCSKYGAFINDIMHFDAQLFGLSVAEARSMDPQQRLLMMAALDAFYDCGKSCADVADRNIGVFIGSSIPDYKLLLGGLDDFSNCNRFSMLGMMPSITANRLSYFFNLKGPSFAVDTACSSSLLAVHLACESIRKGESEFALAGGVCALLTPDPYVNFTSMQVLSSGMETRLFDKGASGFVLGEGVGVVVLMPEEKALQENLPIYAVIRGSGTNQDGRTNGIMLPNADAQQQLIKQVCQSADILPKDIGYIEAHGTGTAMGDPIEANAIGSALSQGREENDPCYVGSVKENIGHLLTGAGIAALIKTALILKHKMIPPSVNFAEANPRINLEKLRLRVPQENTNFPNPEKLAIAGVNSFGFGGANVHVLLSESINTKVSSKASNASQLTSNTKYILPISAKSPAGLNLAVNTFWKFLNTCESSSEVSSTDLINLAYSASVCRDHYEYRAAFLFESQEELQYQLQEWLVDYELSAQDSVDNNSKKLVFVFSGQGTHWPEMGKQLMATEHVFREVIEECDRVIQKLGAWSLIDELNKDKAHSQLIETAISQPAIFAIQAGLLALLKHWGIEPSAVIGHSVGEVAAAYASGAYSLQEAAEIIYHRGKCMDQVSSEGKMLAVRLKLQQVKEWIAPYQQKIDIAAINGEQLITLSGDSEALASLAAKLSEERVFNRFLDVKYAFHSMKMDPVKENFLQSISHLKPNKKLALPMLSTVSAEYIEGWDLVNEYWWQNIRSTVLFSQTIERLASDEQFSVLEVGPSPAVLSSIRKLVVGIKGWGTLKKNHSEIESLMNLLAQLYEAGFNINWQRIYSKKAATYRRIPGYSWQKKEYQLELPQYKAFRLERVVYEYYRQDHRFPHITSKLIVNLDYFSYLRDHQVNNEIVFPASGYIEAMLAAAKQDKKNDVFCLENIDFLQMLNLPDDDTRVSIQTIYDSKKRVIELFSEKNNSNDWSLCAKATVGQNDYNNKQIIPIELFKQDALTKVCREELYPQLSECGLDYGKCFQGIATLWLVQGKALAEISLKDNNQIDNRKYLFHPALLDACLQVMCGTIINRSHKGGKATYIPVQIKRICFYSPIASDTIYSHASLQRMSEKTIEGDITICDESGNHLLFIEGLTLVRIGASRQYSDQEMEGLFYKQSWQYKPLSSHKCPSLSPNDLVISKQLLEGLSGISFIERLASLLKYYIAGFNEGYVARILEIGDSEGVLAARVLTEFKADRIDYHLFESTANKQKEAELRLYDYNNVAVASGELASKLSCSEWQEGSFDIIIVNTNLGDDEQAQEKLRLLPRLLAGGGKLFLTQLSEYPYQQFIDRHEYASVEEVSDFCQSSSNKKMLLLANKKKQVGITTSSDTVQPDAEPKNRWLLVADKGEQLDVLIDELTLKQQPLLQVCHHNKIDEDFFAWLDHADGAQKINRLIYCLNANKDEGGFLKAQEENCYRLIRLLQAVSKSTNRIAHLYVVTHGAESLFLNADEIKLGQSTVNGLMRVIDNEFFSMTCKQIDLSPQDGVAQISLLVEEMLQETQAKQIVYRSGCRWVSQMERVSLEQLLSGGEIKWRSSGGNYRLDISGKGSFEDLKLVTNQAEVLKDDDVEISVYAAGLNFRDVLKTLSMYPMDNDDYLLLGDECAGVVTAVGDGVDNIKVGDEVMTIAPGSFSGKIYAHKTCLMQKPKHLSFEEAATLPVAYLTAYYCLHSLGNIRKGSKVLIQAAAGGVGLAAVQIAMAAGAQIYATASEAKRPLLKSMGIQHVMDSRSMSFIDEVMEKTNGAGVDIILNSLSGEAIERGISILAPFGKFIEIGKRDIYENNALNLRVMRNNISFHAVDVSRLIAADPVLTAEIMSALSTAFNDGYYKPIHHQVYPITSAKYVFKKMSQGKHIGKLILNHMQDDFFVKDRRNNEIIIKPQKAYMIVGGLGDFGLTVADWLVSEGARKIIFVSRSGANTDNKQARVDLLITQEVSVDIEECDVCDAGAINKLVTDTSATFGLAGIFHLAAVIDDASIENLTADQIDKVLKPKIQGAWNLHHASQNIPLDLFVLFSSVSQQFGNPGQAHYAAANAFLDTLHDVRRKQSLPCLTINWGAIRGSAHIDQNESAAKQLAQFGINGISMKQSQSALSLLLKNPRLRASVMNINWQLFAKRMLSSTQMPLFATLVQQSSVISLNGGGKSRGCFKALLLKMESDQRLAAIEKYLCEQIAAVFGLSAKKIDTHASLFSLGVDSLTLIDLKNTLERDLNASLPTEILIECNSLTELAESIMSTLPLEVEAVC